MPHVCIFSSVHTALDNRIFYREARSLQRADYRVTLLAIHPRSEIKDGAKGSPPVEILPLPRLPRWKRPLLWFVILRQALAVRADIYHFHDPELLIVAPWIRLFTRKPVIYDVHEALADFIAIKDDFPALLRRFLAWLFRWLEPALARLVSGLIFADDQIAAQFSRLAQPKTTLFNFPERSFAEKAAQVTATIQERPPHILYLGGIKRGRGIGLMLAVFQQVHQAIPAARLFLVGPFDPASLEGEIRAEITQRGLQEAITITGAIPFDQVGVYLQQAAVGWIPFPNVAKYQKNIPTKLFEYLAYAVPIVSSDLTPVRPFLQDNVTGLLVPPEEAAAHTAAILRLLQNPAEATSLACAGQKAVLANYTWDEMEKRLLHLYEQLLAPAQP